MKKVVVITGPTGVGKTDISIALAKHFQAEIINADASQFRKGLNIGTAKITSEEMQGVKHHLIDIINPEDDFSIKEFQTLGRKLIDKVDKPFVVGGSGLYIQSLITNYELEEVPPREEDKFKDFTNVELYNLLITLDEKAASKIHMNNRRRVLRYIEIAQSKGFVTPVQNEYLYDVLSLCLVRPRDILYKRINDRFDKMINSGWLKECQDLRTQGVNLDNVKDIGYADLSNYLDGKISYDEVASLIKQKTRHYAKRQLTWFKNKMDCEFIDLETTSIEEIIKIINRFYENA